MNNEFQVAGCGFEKSKGVLHTPLMIDIKTVGLASRLLSCPKMPECKIRRAQFIVPLHWNSEFSTNFFYFF